MRHVFNGISLDKWFGTNKDVKGVFGQAANGDKPVTEAKSASVEQEETARHDSMLGSLFFDIFIGAGLTEVFADAIEAPAWARGIDWGQGMEFYEEYADEQYKPPSNAAFGNQNAAIGQGTYAAALSP